MSCFQTQYQVFTKNEGINFLEKVQEMALQSNFKYYYDQLKKFSLLRSYAENGIDGFSISINAMSLYLFSFGLLLFRILITRFLLCNSSKSHPVTLSLVV